MPFPRSSPCVGEGVVTWRIALHVDADGVPSHTEAVAVAPAHPHDALGAAMNTSRRPFVRSAVTGVSKQPMN
jgi:hypothetical protein